MIVALRHIVLFLTFLLVVFGEDRAVSIERVAIKNDVFEAADNATRLRYSKAWNHLDLAESGSKVDPAVITKLADDIAINPGLETFLEGGVGRVKAWEALVDIPNVRVSENAFGTVSKWIDDEIELTFESIQDGAKVINKNGDEVGQLIKSGTEEFLEISDDFFVTSGTPKSFGTITVNSNTGEVYSNIGYVKNTDGTIGFIEDVSSYGNQLVQNTIKQRGSLRSVLTGIQSTEDAHHIIPVQLLKENDVVQAAIEAGFGFNTVANGMAVEKFVKATGAGRHGPHPNYTNQIRNFLNQWKDSPANANWTPTDAKNLLDGLVDDLKQTINTTTAKINDLNLDL